MEIKIITSEKKETEEYIYAFSLKNEIETYLKNKGRINSNDKILIIPNYNLYATKITNISILIVGSFDRGFNEHLSFEFNGKIMEGSLYISSFCFSMNFSTEQVSEIVYENNRLLINPYKIDVEKYREDIWKSLYRFITENSNLKPYIVPALAFKYIKKTKNKIDTPFHCIFRGLPNWTEILKAIALEQRVSKKESKITNNGYYSLSANINTDGVDKIGDLSMLLDDLRKNIGPLTKQKLDFLLKDKKSKPQYYSFIGNKLLLLKGAAGSGKTMRLLEMIRWGVKNNKHVLFLSYNKALVSDIERLLNLSTLPHENVEIRTVQSYMYYLLDDIIAWQQKVSSENNNIQLTQDIKGTIYLEKYYEFIKEAKIKLENGYVPNYYDKKGEISHFHKYKCWTDYVFIDEAQDWFPEERDILYLQLGYNKFVVSLGNQQLIRTNMPLNWQFNNNNLLEAHSVTFPTKSMRQNCNLCKFQILFANKFNFPWDVSINESLKGGRIIVYKGSISLSLSTILKKYTCNYSKDKYDNLLFMVPSDLIQKQKSDCSFQCGGQIMHINKTINKHFTLSNYWKENYDLDVFDMTYKDEKNILIPKPGQYRLISYDTCRGLETYCAVALDMDVFFEEKKKYYRDDNDGLSFDIFSQNVQDRALRFAVMWSLIVFSRPVELLFITIREENSELCKYLKELSKGAPGLIEFVGFDNAPVSMIGYNGMNNWLVTNSENYIDYDDINDVDWMSAFDNQYYDDNLDMDQQSPEFWDCF